jgi:hypothetical protein
MQITFDPGEDDELEDESSNQHVDYGALRVLAIWISQRAGIDPWLGVAIDRGFVVAQAHA